MLKLLIGVKGTGKTKTLIEMVNDALSKTQGDVVCIEKGVKNWEDDGEVADFKRNGKAGVGLGEESDILFGIVLAQALGIFDIAVDDMLFACEQKLDIDVVAVGLKFHALTVKVGVVALNSDIDTFAVKFVAADFRGLLSAGSQELLDKCPCFGVD